MSAFSRIQATTTSEPMQGEKPPTKRRFMRSLSSTAILGRTCGAESMGVAEEQSDAAGQGVAERQENKEELPASMPASNTVLWWDLLVPELTWLLIGLFVALPENYRALILTLWMTPVVVGEGLRIKAISSVWCATLREMLVEQRTLPSTHLQKRSTPRRLRASTACIHTESTLRVCCRGSSNAQTSSAAT
jgi:hypothetical protein